MNECIPPIATLIVCVVLPYVVNLCKKAEWSTNVKRWLAIGLSLIVGEATGIISVTPTPEILETWVLAVIGDTQIAYSAFNSIGVT